MGVMPPRICGLEPPLLSRQYVNAKSIPGFRTIVNFELLYVDANLSKKVVPSYEVSVINFQFDERTFPAHCTATAVRIYALTFSFIYLFICITMSTTVKDGRTTRPTMTLTVAHQ